MDVGMDFGWLLDRFLADFGTKLRGKLEPSWHQNPKNECTKKMFKKRFKKRPENQPSWAGKAKKPQSFGSAEMTRTVVGTKNLQNLQGLARDLQVVHHSCTPAGAPDPVALRANPATVPGVG